MERQYEQSHPWITFQLRLGDLDHETWMYLGEAISKCAHIAGVPLQPELAKKLNEIYLSKSAHATTQIEGNTLSEDEVRQRIRNELPLPPSQEYLGQEIDNIVDAYNEIVDDVIHGRSLSLTPERVKRFNSLVLKNLPPEEDVVPGEFRKRNVLVGNVYRGAPPGDCGHLVERLCDWLEGIRVDTPEKLKQPIALLSAIIAHLYIAWIHPFGNGNGRTARLIEFQLLVRAGVPTVAAHVIADFYNRTRSEYYRVLAEASRPPYRVESFIKYALQGFVDELREQIDKIRSVQLEVMWENYVHGCFHERHTQASLRQKDLILSLPPDAPTPLNKISRLTPPLAADYAGKGPKTVTRDVNMLEKMGLILRSREGILPNIEMMSAFLPLKADPAEEN